MDRVTAQRIFGCDSHPQQAEIQRAYWRLRSHVEERLRLSRSLPGDVEHAGRIEELADLDRALVAMTGSRSAVIDSLDRNVQGRNFKLPNGSGVALGLALLMIVAIRVWAPHLTSLAFGPFSAEAASAVQPAGAELQVASHPQGASLQIRSLEAGEILYDGVSDGRAHAIPAGRYELQVIHPKCDGAWNREVDLRSGETREIDARHCSDRSWLTIESDPSDFELTIDGELVEEGNLAEQSLSPGRHDIEVKRPGYANWRASVTLPVAEHVTVQAKLAPLESPPRSPRVDRSRPAVSAPAASSVATAGGLGERQPTRDELGIAAEWHLSAKQYLLGRYDRDRSGMLDTQTEIESVPCSDWLGLENSFDGSGLALSMTKFFGFDGTKWIEESFGVSQEMRTATYLYLKECGVR